MISRRGIILGAAGLAGLADVAFAPAAVAAGGTDPRDYGGIGDGVADDTAALLAAQGAAQADGVPLYLPAGTWLCSATLEANIVGDGRQASILSYTGAGAAVASSLSYHRRVENLTITTSTGVTGLDLDSVCAGRFTNLLIDGFTQCVWLHSTAGLPRQCLYNTFTDVTAQAVSYGYRIDNISNENWFIGCRVNGAARGYNIVSGNHNQIIGGAIENCSQRGVSITNPGNNETRGTLIMGTRFETNTENVTIFSGVQMTALIAPRFIGGTYIDNGTGTIFVDPNSGALRPGRYATVDRPAPSTVGEGGMIWDRTLGRPVWSTGSGYRDASGAAV